MNRDETYDNVQVTSNLVVGGIDTPSRAFMVNGTDGMRLKPCPKPVATPPGVTVYKAGDIIIDSDNANAFSWYDGTQWLTAFSSATISGTTNRVAKFTSSNSVGNSTMIDNGTKVTVGTNDLVVDETNHRVGLGIATPTRTLDINGTDGMQLLPCTQPGSPADGNIIIDSALVPPTLSWYSSGAWHTAGGGGGSIGGSGTTYHLSMFSAATTIGNSHVNTDGPTQSTVILGNGVDQFVKVKDNTTGNGQALTIMGGSSTAAGDNNAGGVSLFSGLSTGVGSSTTSLQCSTTGLTPNVSVDRLLVVSSKSLTSGSATNVFAITVPNNKLVGGRVFYTIVATDGTVFQTYNESVVWTGYKAGAAAISTPSPVQLDTIAYTSDNTKSISVVWSATVASNTLTISVTPTITGYVASSIQMCCTILNNSDQQIVIS